MTSLLSGGSLGRYQVIEEIGRGGMATVFKAFDPQLGRDVAIKVLASFHTEDPSFVERFRNEAQSVAGLNHPNILGVHDFGEDKGFTYIVMEYLTGGTLKDRLDRRLSVAEALEILTPLAGALDYAHGRGVVHRDIKPANVLIDEHARPVLADFGLARLMGGASALTGTGSVLGTAEYMAPEQALGRTLDHKADLYAFGIIAYQMLVGQTPFPGKSPTETLMAHIHETVPQPRRLDPEFPPRVEASLLKGIAKNPDDRFQTAADLVASLRSSSRPEATEGGQAEEVTLEHPTLALDEAAKRRLNEETLPSDSSDTSTFISPQQARLLAIQHARENTSFYGPRYADTSLAWEVISQEAADDFHEIRLSYRPAGRFRGKAGEEQFTISRGGQIELRQILDEPSPRTGMPIWAAGVGIALVVAVALGAFFAMRDSSDEGELATPVASPASVSAVEAEAPAAAYTDLDTLIDETFARTASLRGIVPTEEVNRLVVTREEMTQKQLDYLERTRQQFGEDEELYEVLGLIPADLDLFGLVVGLFTQQGLVFYDSENRVMYIAQDYGNLGPRLETHLTKEYMHALQQQYFKVSRLEEGVIGNFEGELALVTVLEADARATQAEYAITHFTPELYRQLLSAGSDNPAFLNAPYVVRRLFDFAFTEGADLVKSLLLSGGWPAVNNVLNNPPVSTEQIIHPDKYSTGEAPIEVALPDLIEGLGPGWVAISNNVMGEFILKTYLEDQAKDDAVDPDAAAASAAGWGGDRFAILEGPSGGKFLTWLIVWDSVADAQEFREFATAYTNIPQRGFMGIRNDRVLVILGPSEQDIAKIREQFPGF